MLVLLILTISAIIVLLLLYLQTQKGLRELVDATFDIVQGNLDVRIFREKKDIIAKLAELLNQIASKIKEIRMELETKDDELRTIISCVKDPIFVTDGLGRIRLSNKSFKKLANNWEDEGKHIFDLLRFQEFNILLKEAKEKGSVTGEIKIEKDLFFVDISLLPSKEEVVCVLRNITDLRNLENMRREFVSNVSHEIRTPLTVIKGFLETMEEEMGHRDYLETIKRQTERLVSIVENLLFLSELEEKREKTEMEMVDMKVIAQRVTKLFEKRVSEKHIELQFESDENLPPIIANPVAMEQMLVNLIDNSVKYTNRGRITIRLSHEASFLSVTVEDTGIGIPKEHIPRIFERFYMVDRVKSKALGGTGLGLSIVKHIVLNHNGTIEVESEESRGSKFVVKFPIVGKAKTPSGSL